MGDTQIFRKTVENWSSIHPGLLIVGLAFLQPLEIELEHVSKTGITLMTWLDWTILFLHCLVAGLITLKAYMDKTMGQKQQPPFDPLKPV